MAGGDSQCHSTGAATDGLSISDEFGCKSGGHSACPGGRAHGSRGGTAAGELHSKGGKGKESRGHRVGGLHALRGVGGSTAGTRREMSSAGAIAGIDSFSGDGGEGLRGGAPAVAQEGHGLGPAARSAGV